MPTSPVSGFFLSKLLTQIQHKFTKSFSFKTILYFNLIHSVRKAVNVFAPKIDFCNLLFHHFDLIKRHIFFMQLLPHLLLQFITAISTLSLLKVMSFAIQLIHQMCCKPCETQNFVTSVLSWRTELFLVMIFSI